MMTDPPQKRRFARTRDGTRDATGPKSELVRQLRDLGVRSGDMVMPHVSLRAVGPLADGPQTLVDALIEAVGPHREYSRLRLVARFAPMNRRWVMMRRPPPSPKAGLRSTPDHAPAYPGFGAINEFIRTYPGCRRSAHPDASMAAIGPDAAWLVAPHEMGAAYGPPARRSRVFSPTQEKSCRSAPGPMQSPRSIMPKRWRGSRASAASLIRCPYCAKASASGSPRPTGIRTASSTNMPRPTAPTRSNGSPATISPAPGLRKARSAARNPG